MLYVFLAALLIKLYYHSCYLYKGEIVLEMIKKNDHLISSSLTTTHSSTSSLGITNSDIFVSMRVCACLKMSLIKKKENNECLTPHGKYNSFHGSS